MTGHIDAAVSAALTRHAGGPVAISRRTPLSGGSINRAERLDTSAGRFVLKTSPSAPARFFEAEASGLTAIASSGTSLVVPKVIAAGDQPTAFLLLEYVEPAPADSATDERLGRGLAELHRAGAGRYGLAADNFCGATPQPNPWTEHWIPFYAQARLEHQIQLARDAGALSPATASCFSVLASRLDRWLPEPPEGPRLIHGDLWSGNLLVTAGGRPALLDPAVYYAHREAELGMMGWMGGFATGVYDAYDEVFPLDAGWRERSLLYRLYHVLNHVNLFGTGYLDEALSIARRFS